MADRIICMRAGNIEQIGSPDDLYQRPASVFVASFIGSPPINLFEGKALNGSVQVGETELPFQGDTRSKVTLGLRPEHLRFSGSGVPGRIIQLEPMGREILYVCETPMGLVRVLEAGATGAHRVGSQTHVDFDGPASLIFDTASEELLPNAQVRPLNGA